ncbi:MAG: DUF177 domain-containing protein [Clostridia bacterium]|nr:DUF177 domain-containing protein [Clostridia bacterium]
MIDIDVTEALRRPGTQVRFSWQGDPGYPELTLAAPLTVDCVCELADEGVRVRGDLEAQLVLPCTRCLEPVVRDVSGSFDELFMSAPGDEDVYAYNRETKRISLDQMIYDILSVDIPLQVLCSDTCRGLCPQCGHNLNAGPCECRPPEDDHAVSQNNPFAKLKDLF